MTCPQQSTQFDDHQKYVSSAYVAAISSGCSLLLALALAGLCKLHSSKSINTVAFWLLCFVCFLGVAGVGYGTAVASMKIDGSTQCCTPLQK